MSDFVKVCRREWKRLGVPDPLADEMATDLASDLREAAAEGVSHEQFLGSSASDPRSFAAAWASERGIVPRPAHQASARRRPVALITFTSSAALALVIAALLLLTGEPEVTLATARSRPPHAPALSASPSPPGPHHLIHASAAAPVEWILLFLAAAALCFAGRLWLVRRRSAPTPAAA